MTENLRGAWLDLDQEGPPGPSFSFQCPWRAHKLGFGGGGVISFHLEADTKSSSWRAKPGEQKKTGVESPSEGPPGAGSAEGRDITRYSWAIGSTLQSSDGLHGN